MSSDTLDASDGERLSPTVCYLCRQRKTKCDRRLPNCGFCSKAKLDCHYVERPQKRGLRAGYVSELEARIESLEQRIEGFESRLQTSPRERGPVSTTGHSNEEPSREFSNATASSSQPLPIQDENIPNARSVLDDLKSLPHSFFQQLVEMWFKGSQIWLPILDYQDIQAAVNALSTPIDHIADVELRALIALEASYSTQAICFGYQGRRQLSQYLRSQVLLDTIGKPSPSSVRALMIIAILDYGSDNHLSAFSLLAVCEHMCANTGIFVRLLDDLKNQSTASSEFIPIVLSNQSTNDAALAWCVLNLDAALTLGASWRNGPTPSMEHLGDIALEAIPQFGNSFHTHMHLAAIGLSPVRYFLSTQPRLADSAVDPLQQPEEILKNLISYTDILPETSYTITSGGAVKFDINQVIVKAIIHGAIVMVYQHLVLHVDRNIAEVARQRCDESCEMLIETIQSTSDADTEISNSPVVATFFFIAARYQVVIYRALQQSRDRDFDVLMHGINMIGRRWPYARRLDLVLRAAILEADVGSVEALPKEFWDLTKSHIDISEALKAWVMDYRPSLFTGLLGGPYV